VIERGKRRQKTIAEGGPYFTTAEEDFSTIDHRFLGEAEETFPAFLADLECSPPTPLRGLLKAGLRPLSHTGFGTYRYA